MKKSWMAVWLVTMVYSAPAQNFDTLKQETMSTIPTENPIVCSLSGAELVARKTELQKKVFSRMKSVKESKHGYLFSFEFEEELAQNLFHYILAEQKCCPFFQQEVSIQANNAGILWEVKGTIEVKEMLKEMLTSAEIID